MSEGLEGISIDVSADVSAPEVAPVGGGTEAPVVVPVDASSPVSEQPDADQRVFDNNTKIGSAEDNIRQDVAAENGTALGNGGGEGRAPVTAVGREAAEEKKQADRDALIQQMEQAEALRKEKEENFGMSFKDLVKMLDFIANPELQKKLKDRLTNSIGEKRAEKAMAELNELHQLKKKQEKGEALTPDELMRLEQLKKSEDLKIAVQTAQELQQRANKQELETGGATSKEIKKEIVDAGSGAESKIISLQQKASFESSTDSGIKADAITNQYNMAATAANKNEIKAPNIAVAQNNALQVRANNTGMASLTV